MKPLILLAALVAAIPVAAQTQAQMNAQAGAQWKRADAAMNVQWKRTNSYMKRRDAQNGSRGGGFGYAAALLASQRAWLQFRDSQCTIEGGQFAGGSMQPLARANCLARLTRERTKQLESLSWNQ